MAFDVKGYWTKIFKEAGLSDAEIQPALALLDTKPEVAEKFSRDFVPHQTFQSEMEKQKNALHTHYTKWYNDEIAPSIGRLERYQEQYGDLDNTTTTNNPAVVRTEKGQFVSKKEIEDLLASRDAAVVNLWKKGIDVAQDYYIRFNKKLDTEALTKLAQERNLPIEVAYKELIEPELEKQRADKAAADAKAVEDAKKASYEQGLKDGITRRNLPEDSRPKDDSPFYQRISTVTPTTPAPTDGTNGKPAEVNVSPERSSMNAFLRGWDQAAENKGGAQ